MSTMVKICGITTPEDALAAADAGADLIGFNFYSGSPRCVSISKALEIQGALAQRAFSMPTVGVFVNAPSDEIRQVLAYAEIDYAQLSGDESTELLNDLKSVAFKAIRPQTDAEAVELAATFVNPSIRPALLLDAYHPKQYGGTGNKANPDIARSIAAQYPVLLAGGLNPENVAASVDFVIPWGVDVASGVECAPGVKDHKKMENFIRRAKGLA